MSVSPPLTGKKHKKKNLISPCHIFFFLFFFFTRFSSKSFTIGRLLSGNNIKKKKKKEYILCNIWTTSSGRDHKSICFWFLHPYNIIWFVHPYKWVIPGRVTLYKKKKKKRQQKQKRGNSEHIYNIQKKKVSRLIKQGKMEVIKKKKKKSDQENENDTSSSEAVGTFEPCGKRKKLLSPWNESSLSSLHFQFMCITCLLG